MGNKVVIFTEEQLEDYQDVTYFTRKDILRVFKRYRDMDPSNVPKTMTGDEAHTVKVPCELVVKIAELKENPFRQRICQVFSDDSTGNLTFEDFLDMLSIFSEHSPRDVKAIYAFKIYDYDGDDYLSVDDMEQTLRALTRNELDNEAISLVCEKVLEESDVDDDGKLSFSDFEHVISRAPDFVSLLCLSRATILKAGSHLIGKRKVNGKVKENDQLRIRKINSDSLL